MKNPSEPTLMPVRPRRRLGTWTHKVKRPSMHFRNAVLYSLSGFDAEKIAPALGKTEAILRGAQPVPPGQFRVSGFVRPRPDVSDDLLYSPAGRNEYLLCYATRVAVLPPAAIKERTDEAIAAFTACEGHIPGRRAKSALKDEVIATMLPKAFWKLSLTPIWIRGRHNQLIVNTGSVSRAEDAISALHSTVRDVAQISIQTIDTEIDPRLLVRALAEGAKTYRLYRTDELKLRGADGERIAFSSSAELDSESTQRLAHSKTVERIGVSLGADISAVLDIDLVFRKIAAVVQPEDEPEDNIADYLLFADSLGRLIDATIADLGGEKIA